MTVSVGFRELLVVIALALAGLLLAAVAALTPWRAAPPNHHNCLRRWDSGSRPRPNSTTSGSGSGGRCSRVTAPERDHAGPLSRPVPDGDGVDADGGYSTSAGGLPPGSGLAHGDCCSDIPRKCPPLSPCRRHRPVLRR